MLSGCRRWSSGAVTCSSDSTRARSVRLRVCLDLTRTVTSEVIGGAQYLGEFFGLPRSEGAAARSLVRLSVPERVALSVDHVAGSVELERSDISPLPVHFQAAERQWFHGCALYANTLLLLISTDHLLGRVGTVAAQVLSEPCRPIGEPSAPPHERPGEQPGDLFFAEMDQLLNTIEQQRMTNDERLPWAELQII